MIEELKLVENVDELKMQSLEVGTVVETKYHTYPGQGSAKYQIYSPEDIIPNSGGENAESISDEFGSGFLISNGNYAIIKHNAFIHPEQWGLNNSLSNELCNADRINAMIEYSAPFKWKGSVYETKQELGKIRAKILGGIGPWLIKKPILLNPFMNWEGVRVGGFWGNSDFGTTIVADFDDNDLFALDSAPWNESGERLLGKEYKGTDWDNGLITGCMGINLKNIQCFIKDTNNLRGVVNLSSATESFLEKNRFIGGNIGIQLSCSWAGSLVDNNVGSKAIGIYFGSDVTNYNCVNNYLYHTGEAPNEDVFTWPPFPSDDMKNKTVGILSRYGNPHASNNTIEHFEHGIRASNCLSANYYDNYMEDISNYLYVFHTMSANIVLGYSYNSSDTNLMWIDGNQQKHRIKFDMSGSQNITSLNVGHTTIDVDIVGANNQGIGLFYNEKINYKGISEDKTEIYIDSSEGSDDYWGVFENSPVKTVQGALNRCKQGGSNIIYCQSNSGIETTDNIGGTDISEFHWESGTSLEFTKYGNEQDFNPVIYISTTLDKSNFIPINNLSITMKDVDIYQENSIDLSYSSVFYCSGNNNVSLIGTNITLQNSLFSAKKFGASNINAVHEGGSINNGVYINEDPESGPLNYIACASNDFSIIGEVKSGGNDYTYKIIGFI